MMYNCVLCVKILSLLSQVESLHSPTVADIDAAATIAKHDFAENEDAVHSSNIHADSQEEARLMRSGEGVPLSLAAVAEVTQKSEAGSSEGAHPGISLSLGFKLGALVFLVIVMACGFMVSLRTDVSNEDHCDVSQPLVQTPEQRPSISPKLSGLSRKSRAYAQMQEDQEQLTSAGTSGTSDTDSVALSSDQTQAFKETDLSKEEELAKEKEQDKEKELSRKVSTLCEDAASVLELVSSEDNKEILAAFSETRHYKAKCNHAGHFAYSQYLATENVQQQLQSLFAALSQGEDVVTVKGLELMCSSFRIDVKNSDTGMTLEAISFALAEYQWLIQGILEPLSKQEFANVFALWHAVALQILDIKTAQADEFDVSVRPPDGVVLFRAEVCFPQLPDALAKGRSTITRLQKGSSQRSMQAKLSISEVDSAVDV